MGVYWYIINLTKGKRFNNNLGKFGEFDFEERLKQALTIPSWSPDDKYIFLSEEGDYVPYPIPAPFIFEEDLEWYDNYVQQYDGEYDEIIFHWPSVRLTNFPENKESIDNIWKSDWAVVKEWLKYFDAESVDDINMDKYNLTAKMFEFDMLNMEDWEYLKNEILDEGRDPQTIIQHFSTYF